jgi:hypothetical protein
MKYNSFLSIPCCDYKNGLHRFTIPAFKFGDIYLHQMNGKKGDAWSITHYSGVSIMIFPFVNRESAIKIARKISKIEVNWRFNIFNKEGKIDVFKCNDLRNCIESSPIFKEIEKQYEIQW